ncbi:MAG: mechanosensitive ion channel [Candidatus Eisenbacteria bacterium]|uniref:Mechanosensitive ion channel n=1 Tax=Eiseniibacteriota bacterium TaxID=2212470 RepID=A0A956N9X0_UNCEI|nr:mechanosensitive ion channel [Candidatus Eisenbacteria bacterium]MCB9465600.1 mechanosensitive ion channel [Candidatus Eisenbacteria bacterium]
MEPDTLERIWASVVPFVAQYGLQVIGAVVILVIGRIGSNIVGGVVERGLRKANADPSLRGFLVNMTKIAILAFAVIAALSKFGVQTTSFVAVLGAAGFAVGLALQGSLSNFAAGVMILIFRPIQVGDLIESNGHLGFVKEVGLFVTTLATLDNQKVIIPNATLTGGIINNVNGYGVRRVDLTAGISYGDEMSKAKDILLGILRDHPKVLAEPAPSVAVSELGDSSVNFVVRPWCNAADYWDVYFDVTQSIKERFDAQGVKIPFPQRDVHLFQAAK